MTFFLVITLFFTISALPIFIFYT